MSTLVVYGRPPSIPGHFTSGITQQNRAGFERLLVPELEKLAKRSLAPATVKPICRPQELADLLKTGAYDTLVFYGHAFQVTTVGASNRTRSELQLESACGKYLTAADFEGALRTSRVKTVLVAGCASNAFAADLSARPGFNGVLFGGLAAYRWDEIEGTNTAVSHLTIVPQAVKWWSGK